jgi:hypothetical protein
MNTDGHGLLSRERTQRPQSIGAPIPTEGNRGNKDWKLLSRLRLLLLFFPKNLAAGDGWVQYQAIQR